MVSVDIKKRYKEYPNWGVIYIDKDMRHDKYQLTMEHYHRASLNAKADILFSDLYDGKESTLDETNFAKWLA